MWNIRGIFTEYSWGIHMCRLCIGYVSGMCRVCIGAYRERVGGESAKQGKSGVVTLREKPNVLSKEKNRKRNFVDFVCICENFFVPLHAFRACMRTTTISQVRAPIHNKAKTHNAKHYKHDRLHQRRTDFLNPYLRGD